MPTTPKPRPIAPEDAPSGCAAKAACAAWSQAGAPACPDSPPEPPDLPPDAPAPAGRPRPLKWWEENMYSPIWAVPPGTPAPSVPRRPLDPEVAAAFWGVGPRPPAEEQRLLAAPPPRAEAAWQQSLPSLPARPFLPTALLPPTLGPHQRERRGPWHGNPSPLTPTEERILLARRRGVAATGKLTDVLERGLEAALAAREEQRVGWSAQKRHDWLPPPAQLLLPVLPLDPATLSTLSVEQLAGQLLADLDHLLQVCEVPRASPRYWRVAQEREAQRQTVLAKYRARLGLLLAELERRLRRRQTNRILAVLLGHLMQHPQGMLALPLSEMEGWGQVA